jgi:tetratricopeptide (TPR) repeat protein
MDSINKLTESTLVDQARNFFLLGLEYHRKELYEDSEYFYLLSLNFLPDRLSTLTNLIAVLLKMGKLEEARLLLNRSLNLYPNDEKLHLNQGLFLQLNKNYQLAVVSFDKAINLMPDFEEAFYNRGIALQELKRLDEALLSYNKAIELKNNYA